MGKPIMQNRTSNSKPQGLPGGLIARSSYLGLLWLAYGGVGWLLSAYRAPAIVWLGTWASTLYLAWTGMNGVILVSVWVVAVLSTGAVRHAWMWRIPRPSYQIEPLVLLIIWLLLLGLVALTAIVHHQFQRRCDRVQTLGRLIIPLWLGLIAGSVLYAQVTLPLLSP